MTRRRVGLVLVLAGVIFGLLCGTALAATVVTPTTPATPSTVPAVRDSGSPTASRPEAAPTSAAPKSGPAQSVHAASGPPPPVPPVFAGDVQAVAVRIEADEPLPVGPGDIPSMSGQVNAQEQFATATAAVDLLGAVVGPKIADPTGDAHQYAELPQATCLYPSNPNTAAQSYPFDGSDQQTAQSETTCAAGPSATGLAYAGQIGGNAGVTNPAELTTLGASALPLGIQGVATGHESLGPDTTDGSVRVSADAEANDFSIPGLLHVAGVEATGYTEASGRPGGASTAAQVTVSGLTIGGSTISVGPAGVALGDSKPVPLSGAGPLVEQFNQAAGSVGCSLTVLSNPSTYPQGTLFARPPLPNRVAADGTDAGSTGAGVAVRCVMPDSLNPTNFKPLILQILFGFVGTEADASTTNTAFGIGALGSLSPAAVGTGTGFTTTPSPGGSMAVSAGSYSSGSAGAPTGSVSLADSGATAGRPLPAAARPPPSTAIAARPVGALVPLRTPLEVGGLALAVLIALAGVGLVAPWRVTLAPVDHPEV